MRNFKIVIQYDGARYQGWQKQGNTENTLQGRFERLLERLAGEPVQIQASGRTDAGVHAHGQVANFHMDTMLKPQELAERINRYLPEDVAVIDCSEVGPRFHSRLNAVSKVYRYRVLNSNVPCVFDRKYIWQIPDKLDICAMREAAAFLEGRHDFASFTSAKKSKKSTVRTLLSVRLEQVGDEIQFWYEGDGFLFHMVRILTGTLVEVGLHQRSICDVTQILAEKKREKAGRLAPAAGLSLMEVRF